MGKKESNQAWYERERKKKTEHELQNGLEVLGKHIRLSDFVKEKILSGKTQVLIIGRRNCSV